MKFPLNAGPDADRPAIRRHRAWLAVLGSIAALPALGATVLRLVPPSSDRLGKLAAFIPYGLAFWVPALILLTTAATLAWQARTRGRVALTLLSLCCAAGLTAAAGWQLPSFVPDGGAATSPPLLLTSLNVAGRADADLAAAASTGADLAIFVEATPEWLADLPADFRAAFPYRAPATAELAESDTVIFSRHPITSAEALPRTRFQQWSAVVTTPQLGRVRVVAVHPCNPYCGNGAWQREAASLRGWLAGHDDPLPTIVAGDFNAVDDHGTMRALYDDGFRGADHLAGAGFVRTWPANRRFPPLIGIDHVLVDDQLTATEFGTFQVPGTDHLGVRAVLAATNPRQSP